MRLAPEGLNIRDIDPWDALYVARDKGKTVNVTIVRTRQVNGQGLTWEASLGDQENLFEIVGLIPESESGLPDGISMNWFRNQSIAAKVKGIDRRNNLVALSRREVVEENLSRLLDQLEESERLCALIRAARPAGIVVDIGGGVLIDIPRKKINLSRAVPIEVQYTPGQLAKVEVTGIDKTSKRIDVAIIDPWQPNEFARGEMVTGKIVQTADNVAFVQVRPGLVGIAPYPKSEHMEIGDTASYQVRKYDEDSRVLHLVRWDDERIRGRRGQHARRNRKEASSAE
jgi:small subunit ribosomal protein S1